MSKKEHPHSCLEDLIGHEGLVSRIGVESATFRTYSELINLASYLLMVRTVRQSHGEAMPAGRWRPLCFSIDPGPLGVSGARN
jgi:hypothetical protein